MSQNEDAKWRQVLFLMQEDGGDPYPRATALARSLGLCEGGGFTLAFVSAFPAAMSSGWHDSVPIAQRTVGIETLEEAKKSSDAIIRFLDDEGYTRLDGESVAARTIRILQEAEQRAATGKIVKP